MRFLSAALFFIHSLSAFAMNDCQKFLDYHPKVIISEFELNDVSYRYEVAHTKFVTDQNCIIDVDYAIATLKTKNAVKVFIEKYENGVYIPIIEKTFSQFKINLNTNTAYYQLLKENLPSLVTARKTKSNLVMTTYKQGKYKKNLSSLNILTN